MVSLLATEITSCHSHFCAIFLNQVYYDGNCCLSTRKGERRDSLILKNVNRNSDSLKPAGNVNNINTRTICEICLN